MTLFHSEILNKIDPGVHIHPETTRHTLSSSAACLNVLGPLCHDPKKLATFLGRFIPGLEKVYSIPSGMEIGGRKYNDQTECVLFEWVGPQESPINEKGGKRGCKRTSIDAWVLAQVEGKLTQILIEWKYTEGVTRPFNTGLFAGGKGVERLSRYSRIVADLRKAKKYPFRFSDEFSPENPESAFGLSDLSPDPLYQLLRMTLLARRTTPLQTGIPGLSQVEDYRILHLSHSKNQAISSTPPSLYHLSPGLKPFLSQSLQDTWKNCLSDEERERFFSGFWDLQLDLFKGTEFEKPLKAAYLDSNPWGQNTQTG